MPDVERVVTGKTLPALQTCPADGRYTNDVGRAANACAAERNCNRRLVVCAVKDQPHAHVAWCGSCQGRLAPFAHVFRRALTAVS